MTDLHHPSDETLLRHAAGTLGAGASVVVAAHVASCRHCQEMVGDFEALGGVLLDDMPLGDTPENGLARAFAAIERRGDLVALEASKRSRPALPVGVLLPASVSDCDFGPWRTLAPGVRVSRADGDWARASKLRLLRVDPGKHLLAHGHSGIEWTCVLSGSFSDGRARFAAGDICEVDQSVDHRPVIEDGEVCICLVAAEGGTLHHGILGRLHQAIFGD